VQAPQDPKPGREAAWRDQTGAAPAQIGGSKVSPTTVILVRHGLAGSNVAGMTSGSAPGEGLVAEGVEQARRLAAALAAERIDLGVTSSFRRTQETLALALEGRSVQALVVPELDEIAFGSFDGGPLADYRAWAASAEPTIPAPGSGESRAAVAERYARGLRRLLALDAETVLVVGHALFCRYVLDAARGLAPAARMAPVEHAVPYRVSVPEIAVAAELLEEWSRAPRFRDPSDEGGERG
jgi:broad specificity phosphatase PhoE